MWFEFVVLLDCFGGLEYLCDIDCWFAFAISGLEVLFVFILLLVVVLGLICRFYCDF